MVRNLPHSSLLSRLTTTPADYYYYYNNNNNYYYYYCQVRELCHAWGCALTARNGPPRWVGADELRPSHVCWRPNVDRGAFFICVLKPFYKFKTILLLDKLMCLFVTIEVEESLYGPIIRSI